MREKINRIKKNILFKNIVSLSFLQVSNYIFPLITLPYLVRVLGPEKYGLVNFAIAFTAYFNIITDFGFNLSVTREISLNRTNQKRISSIVSTILFIKLILLAICFSIFFILIILIPFFNKYFSLYLLAFTIVMGNSFIPLWFFQGIEDMKYITYFNFAGKFFYTILIFVLIQNSHDFFKYIGLNGILMLSISILSILFIFIKFKIRLIFPNKNEVLHQINKSKHIFFSNIGISLYTNSTTFILGLLTSNNIVGYFVAADKIRIAIQSIYSPVSQAIYPRLASLFNSSKAKAVDLLRRISSWVILLGGSVGILILIFSKEIIILILGNEYLSSIPVLRIMAFLPMVIAVSNLGGIQVMLNIGMKQTFMKIILTAAVLNLVLLFVFIPFYNANGAAFSMLITEIFVTVIILINLNKKNINIFKSEYV